ncbi:CopG family transcriptional regulator [Desulfofundulus salinus]|uniref:Ribbon-helix-helix protein, CopG family n=1 Tax=Desulfofundulus salinus TaxID=2419843 RepID=A0A494X162_9FIRM|nr:CopG family transcriptional regulator [Desulfofundulus salinum]RKO66885.1 hypothetical protein D7024_07955 [Desulfofundulus salinum]
MSRYQVYIKPHHDALLKKRAGEPGVTEAELIRRAIEAHLAAGPSIPRDISAWEREKQFILSRVKKGDQERGRQWQREELYVR